jgi:hypothetical protein
MNMASLRPMTDRKARLDLSSLFPALVLAGLLALLVGGWWLFPRLHAYVAMQDCFASGRTDCDRRLHAP